MKRETPLDSESRDAPESTPASTGVEAFEEASIVDAKRRLLKHDGRYIVFYPVSDSPGAVPCEIEEPSGNGYESIGESANQLRWDPTLGEWISYATHRQERTFLPPAEYCPLCPTEEGGFPTEVPCDSYGIVVFENRFPALSPRAEIPEQEDSDAAHLAPGKGVCEVVLYSQEHEATLAGMSEDRIRDLVEVWSDRYVELGRLDYVDYVFVFENKGEAIGVTLHHPHGQIYGFPFVPPKPDRELHSAREHRSETDRCLHCGLLERELEDGSRIIFSGEHFVAFVPFAARYPYEVHLYARRCVTALPELSANEKGELAVALKGVLSSYDALFGFSLPYVMCMHQAPTDGDDYEGVAHLHIEFYPPNRTEEKLKYLAGSELGAGTFVVDALPEDTAASLREAARQAAS